MEIKKNAITIENKLNQILQKSVDLQFAIEGDGWLDISQMLEQGYLEVRGSEKAATQFELTHSSATSYYIKECKNFEYKTFKLIINKKDLKTSYKSCLILLDNNKYIIGLRDIINDLCTNYIKFTEKGMKLLSNKPYKEISIIYTGRTIYFDRDLAINYSIYHNSINPLIYDKTDASIETEDYSSTYLYSNSLVEPISIDKHYGICELFGLHDYGVFCGESDEFKDYDIDFRKLLGEFYAIFGISSSLKQNIVGISHYSRCFNLNYFLPPLNFMGNSERINEFRELMCLSNGLTLKNVLLLLDGNKLKLPNVKKYKLIIPNPSFLGEEIIINTKDNFGKIRRIERSEEYTFQSQYVNHPHYLWEEFDEVLTKVLKDESKWKKDSSLNISFLEAYKKYKEMKNPKLFFKCQTLMTKIVYDTYLSLLTEFFTTFHRSYGEKVLNMTKDNTRIYAYMGERIYSFFCYYFYEHYRNDCYMVPVSCYKKGLTSNIEFTKKLKENYNLYNTIIDNSNILYFYANSTISKTFTIESSYERIAISFGKGDKSQKDINYFNIKRDILDDVSGDVISSDLDNSSVLNIKDNDNNYYTLTLSFGNWTLTYDKSQNSKKIIKSLIDDKTLPEIVSWEDYPIVSLDDNEILFVKTYCPITIKSEKDYINKRISIMTEAITEKNEKIYILYSKQNSSFEYHLLKDDKLISNRTKIKVLNEKTNDFENKEINFNANKKEFQFNKNEIYTEICLLNWDYIPVYIKLAQIDF